MTRETIRTHKVALLATGDEISNGDILNTNSQEIARKLFDNGIQIGMHMVTSDNISEIEQAINFLLQDHDALIITGGLGPTSDDLTRFALSNSVNKPLVFHEESWQLIVERLNRFGYTTPPQSNRQQALFPEGATIIPNPNGTAAGCAVQFNTKLIFMLPGPPIECLPMFDQVVLPNLKSAGFQQIEFHKNWLLFGVSEGQIAEELDQLAKPYDCTTGYRLFYPYIEFKIRANNQQDFLTLVPQIEKAIAPYLIADGQYSASELLRRKIETLSYTLSICDQVTGGLLETILKTPLTHTNLIFTSLVDATTNVHISGLTEYWQHTATTQTQLVIQMAFAQVKENIDVQIPFRGNWVKQYAVEFICWKILNQMALI